MAIIFDSIIHKKTILELVRIHGQNYSTIRHLLLQYHLCGKTDMRKFKQIDVKQAVSQLKQHGVSSQRIQKMMSNNRQLSDGLDQSGKAAHSLPPNKTLTDDKEDNERDVASVST